MELSFNFRHPLLIHCRPWEWGALGGLYFNLEVPGLDIAQRFRPLKSTEGHLLWEGEQCVLDLGRRVC